MVKLIRNLSITVFLVIRNKTVFGLIKLFKIKYFYSLYGFYFTANPNDQTFYYYIFKSYGKFFSNFLKNDNAANIFLDIGSNQGLYALCAAKNERISSVYAFEPQNNTYSLLEQNVIVNNCQSKIKSHCLGIGKMSGSVSATYNKNHSGNTTILNVDQHSVDEALSKLPDIQRGQEVINLEIISHDELDNLISVDEHSVIGVKIDAEGMELEIIETLIKTKFWDRIKWIYYEVDFDLIDHEKTTQVLEKEGFKETFKDRIDRDATLYDLLVTRDNI